MNALHPTYPKRAKQLVKHGRAKWLNNPRRLVIDADVHNLRVQARTSVEIHIDGDVGSVDGTVDEINGDVGSIDGNVDEIHGDVDEVNGAVDEIHR